MRGSTITLYVLLFSLALALPARGEPLASNERLIEMFERAAFHVSMWPDNSSFRKLEKIRRWRIPIRYEIDPYELTLEILDDLVLHKFSGLTWLQIRAVEPGAQPKSNFLVWSSPLFVIRGFLKSLNSNRRDLDVATLGQDKIIALSNTLRCEQITVEKDIREFGIGHEPSIKLGIILFHPEIEAPVRRHCIVKMMLQAFGLGGISLTTQRSMTKVDGRDLSAFPLDAKILLRTLYDKRIEPGMDRAAAMAAAREIIPELTAAVARDGVEALYQYNWQWPAR